VATIAILDANVLIPNALYDFSRANLAA